MTAAQMPLVRLPTPPAPLPMRPSVRQGIAICAEVAEKHGLTVETMQLRYRRGPLARARFEAMYRMAAETTLTHVRMAALLGVRDHSTIYYGIRRHMHFAGLPAPRKIAKRPARTA